MHATRFGSILQVALDLIVTQVVLTRGGVTGVPQRSIFAGTNMGVVRTFALPVTGSFETYQVRAQRFWPLAINERRCIGHLVGYVANIFLKNYLF